MPNVSVSRTLQNPCRRDVFPVDELVLAGRIGCAVERHRERGFADVFGRSRVGGKCLQSFRGLRIGEISLPVGGFGFKEPGEVVGVLVDRRPDWACISITQANITDIGRRI